MHNFAVRTNAIMVDNFYLVNDVIKNQNKLIQAIKQIDNKLNNR